MLEQKAEELLDWHVDMLRQGMMEYEALEFIKVEVYALPPEKYRRTAMDKKKQFPTPAMLKAREELAKRTPAQKAADEAAMRADVKKYYENMRPPLDVTEIDPGE